MFSVNDPGFFFPPRFPTIAVARRCGLRGARTIILSNYLARIAWAVYLRRRVVRNTFRARRQDGRYRLTAAGSPGDVRQSFRGAVLVAAAPGERAGVEDLVASIRCYEGNTVKIVVADDLTREYPRGTASFDFPDVDFVRPRVAAGSKYRPFPTLQVGLLHILRNYDVPVILKVDPDSLLIGAGSFELAAERFASDPVIGLLGTTDVQADGTQTDYRWISWMAHPELRWSRRLRELFRRAQDGARPPHFAHAGGYYLSAHAAREALSVGLLPYRQPIWSLQGDDLIVSLIVRAAGFRIQSFGAPGDPIACAARYLPVEPAQALAGGFKVVHSVRTSPSGMSEAAIRGEFREARTRSVPPAAPA